MLSIQKIADGIAIAAQEYPIKKVELFGSYANGNNTSDSDVDLLIEFETPQVSLITLNRVKYFLEEIWQKDVDLVHAPIPKDSIIEIDRRIPLYGA